MRQGAENWWSPRPPAALQRLRQASAAVSHNGNSRGNDNVAREENVTKEHDVLNWPHDSGCRSSRFT